MSATVTLTTAAPSSHSLCLYSPAANKDQPPSLSTPSSTHSSTSSGHASGGGSFTDTWPMAVEALAQRLWDCGREALLLSSRRSSTSDSNSDSHHESGLVFGETGEATDTFTVGSGGQDDVAVTGGGLCDGPYVRIDYSGAVASSPLLATDFVKELPPPLPLQQHAVCSRPPLIRYQARTNPFKIMMRMPVTAASAKQEKREEEGEIPSRVYRRAEEGEAKAATPVGSKNNSLSCTHCKQGNFLEFCFVGDRCSCRCHDDCPCNPCLDIRDLRQSIGARLRCHRGSGRAVPRRQSKAGGGARGWVDDAHPPQLQHHRQPSLCSQTT